MDHHQGVKLGSTGMNRIDPTTSLRHGALERLRFIDARLFWEARINRADLIETFSVSPAQAALDFKEYLKMAGRGVVYDTRSKAYVRATSFKPAFGAPDAGKALSDMLAAGDPLVATLPKLERPLDPYVVARVRLAARSAERLHVDYQSFTRPQPQKRWIAPRRLVSDGDRWHARCWCYEHNEWRDFVLARVAAIDAVEPAGQLPRDRDWEDAYRLVLKPAEGLSKGQRVTVIREYAMQAGRLVVTIPRAMRLYAIRRWGLDRPTTRLKMLEDRDGDAVGDRTSE
jgi:hypothetical protein